MTSEREVIVETFLPSGEASRSAVRVRPIAGQGFSSALRVQCSKKMRESYAVGTRFVLTLKIMGRGGPVYLHAHHDAPFRLATEEDTRRLLARSGLMR